MLSEPGRILLGLVPSLRAFAFCLTQDRSEADEVVCRSLTEIWWEHRSKESVELKMAAFTVIHRVSRTRAPANRAASHAAARSPDGEPNSFSIAFEALETTGREALSLVAFWAFTTEQAAKISGTDKHTIESRIANACSRLASNQL